MMDACTKSSDLLKSLAEGSDHHEDADRAGSENSHADRLRDKVSALRDLSGKIDDLAGALENRLNNLREAPGRRPLRRKRETKKDRGADDLLKTTKEVGRAAPGVPESRGGDGERDRIRGS